MTEYSSSSVAVVAALLTDSGRSGPVPVVVKMVEEAETSDDDEFDMMKEVTAASDTTVSAIMTFFLAMALYPAVQRKAQMEIDTLLGISEAGSAIPTFEQKGSLPYIEAIFREVLRWRPVIPLSLLHATSTEDVYNGYYIPKAPPLMRILTKLATTAFSFSILASAAAQSDVDPKVLGASTDLLDASHILHFLDVVDAFGHVSVRNPVNDSQFLMTFSIAPAQATSHSIVTYDINNATALQLTFNASVTGSAIPTGFAERFIHSEIYKRFPAALAVVHTHTREVLPFANQPQQGGKAAARAPALGSTGTPIFDIRDLPSSILPQSALHDLLVRDEPLGDALASTLAEAGNGRVVLMRGHGMALYSPTLRESVFDAFYVKEGATVQLQAMLLGGGTPVALDSREVMDTSTTDAGL
ncbi:Aldolase-II domain-containing protein [Mycena chlorophos]|uniref:Aldolase-II domain-containing protein n=1 Tax=Mycena chlorophos TaxID=658473 RepID=A0A8H6TK54_MYCCL|nr:Aldolase-II domain-containing protein [Mycena chlorophos]